jgi:hypothetical protein
MRNARRAREEGYYITGQLPFVLVVVDEKSQLHPLRGS